MSNNINRLVFNVGKKMLRYITEPIATKKVEYVTVNQCSGENCIFFNADDSYSKLYCSKFCPKTRVVMPIVKPLLRVSPVKKTLLKLINPKGIYTAKPCLKIRAFIAQKQISERQYLRLSATQIKQVLALFANANSGGIIKSISKSDLASAINCTEKTIENNNRVLSKLGIISISKSIVEEGKLCIIINNYRDQYKESGSGYYVMSGEMFSTLVQIENVNALRLAIHSLIKDDMNSVVNNVTKFSRKELKNILPSHANTYTSIKNIIGTFVSDVKTNVFNWKDETEYFIVNIDRAYDGKVIKKDLSVKFENDFMKAISESYSADENINEESLKEKFSRDIKDLVSMSFEYGFDVVKKVALHALSIKDDIKTFGAYVRKLISTLPQQGKIDLT